MILVTEQNFPEVQFAIKRSIEDIPPCEPCPLCTGETTKTILPYKGYGENLVAINSTAPGYECNDCGAGLYDSETTISLFVGAARALPINEHSKRKDFISGARKLRNDFHNR